MVGILCVISHILWCCFIRLRSVKVYIKQIWYFTRALSDEIDVTKQIFIVKFFFWYASPAWLVLMCHLFCRMIDGYIANFVRSLYSIFQQICPAIKCKMNIKGRFHGKIDPLVCKNRAHQSQYNQIKSNQIAAVAIIWAW